MSEPPQPAIGVTEVPDDLPEGSVVARKDCGCYLIMRPGDPPVSEFTCEHGWVVAEQRKPPPPDGTIVIG